MTTTVLLARHGETTWNRAGRIQGWAPTPLTDRGRAQADRLAAGVAEEYDVDRLLCSDLRRAKETARPIARETGLDPTFESAWRERDFGALQGFTDEELFEEFPEYALRAVGSDAASARPPSGESLLEARTRVLDRWHRLRDRTDGAGVGGGDETVLVVAHNGPIRLLLGAIRGLDVVTTMTERHQANASVTAVELDGDGGSGDGDGGDGGDAHGDGGPTARVVRESVVYE